MSLLPTNNGLFGGTSLINNGSGIFNKLLGGAIGAYYGSKNGNFMDGLMGGYAGYQKPTSLYDRIMDKYLPKQSILTIRNIEDQERGF